jgi:hypothetical protein
MKHNTLEKAIETALRSAWTDSNPVMRYHVCTTPAKRFEVVTSGNEHEPGSIYTARAEGGDATMQIESVENLRQTAREEAQRLRESMEREESLRD